MVNLHVKFRTIGPFLSIRNTWAFIFYELRELLVKIFWNRSRGESNWTFIVWPYFELKSLRSDNWNKLWRLALSFGFHGIILAPVGKTKAFVEQK